MTERRKIANMSFRIEVALRDAFSSQAKLNGDNPSQLLRDFMRAYIKQAQDATKKQSY